jgi:osmotically-inducible protein OsmY
MVAHERERDMTERVAAAVPGVAAVDNRLRVMNRARLNPTTKN